MRFGVGGTVRGVLVRHLSPTPGKHAVLIISLCFSYIHLGPTLGNSSPYPTVNFHPRLAPSPVSHSSPNLHTHVLLRFDSPAHTAVHTRSICRTARRATGTSRSEDD